MCEILEFEIPLKDGIKGTKLLIPGLDVSIVSYRSSLCPSNYNKSIVCFWEGDLEVVLQVGNKTITLNDHDKKNNKEHHYNTNTHEYIFKGLGPKVVKMKDTFLIAEVKVCNLDHTY
ncbi:hypothetical protein BQ9231_00152 [Cedratvirus lausannensis]|uniref:Uncharacterized protein n=1 Tax=Cedratvirus lausannensis TaxID=2023205 RepID=A0A285Q1F7_9VIRU|nr:hypothetical protein BQ9231_00152 [Cedratvirus lausannensis]